MQSNYLRNYYTFVSGLEGAKNYPILANQSLMLMDSEQPICYMKSADATGKPTLKCYKLVEVEEKDIATKPSELQDIYKRLDELYELIKGEKKDA